MDGFHSAAMKANRAEAALWQALKLEAQWRNGVPLDMAAIVEPSAHGFDAVVRLRNVPPVPDDIVLLLDDFFHHARSALDHVMVKSRGVVSLLLFLDGGWVMVRR